MTDDDEPDRPRTRPLAAPPPRAGDSLLGRTIDGRFRLLAERGRGGMSVVYAALEIPLGRQVALKCAIGPDPGARLRILREAAVLACLDHPGIPPVYTSGHAAELGPYLVTRLLAGRSVETGRGLAAVADAADAVAHAHAQGIVHRDLKPAHILLDARPFVVDWGLARELPGRSAVGVGAIAITEPGTPVGTPGYWAPEQRAGALPDPSADVYSLGAIVARLVGGREPDVEASPPPVGPRPLRALIARACDPDPRARLASAAEFADALRRIRM